MTKQRAVIHDIIRRSNDHLTADAIYRRAKERIPSIAVGTVYRNLRLMCDDGDIMRVQIEGEPDRFDKNPEYHDHAICDCCGKVADISSDGLEEILRERTGLEIQSYNLTVHCVCSDCRERLHSN